MYDSTADRKIHMNKFKENMYRLRTLVIIKDNFCEKVTI